LGDDLKQYEVHIEQPLPVWYHETIEEFIINYCPTMHVENKLMLLHLIEKVKPKPVKQAKVVKLRKYG